MSLKNHISKNVFSLALSVFFAAALAFSVNAEGAIRFKKFPAQNPSASGFSNIGFNVGCEPDADVSIFQKKASLPQKYSSVKKGLVTPVKDQGKYGSCWAFASISAAETSAIKEFPEYTAKNCDFSEAHLAYFTFSGAADRLKLTRGDQTQLLGTDFLDVGGNHYFSTFTLAKWFGPVNEKDAPYKEASPSTEYEPSLAYSKNRLVLENSLWVSMKDVSAVKSLIKKYGSCTAAYFHDDMNFNFTNSAYYQPFTLVSNHSITIVGWDDTYSKNNFGTVFNAFSRPRANGAWLVKNSYGEAYGDKGYIWISYEDPSLLSDNAAFFDFEKRSEYDSNYQYDGTTCSMGLYYCKNKLLAANCFTAANTEKLRAVSFFTAEPNTACSVQIYKDLRSLKDPTKGTPVFSKPISCSQKFAGYHTVKLPEEIQLNKGDKFSVVVTLKKKNSDVFVFTDYVGSLNSGGTIVVSKAISSPGQSFVSEDGKKWDDVNKIGNGENIRIKALTKKGYAAPKKIALNKTSLRLALNGKTVIKATVSPKNKCEKLVWKSSNPSVAKVSAYGTVTAVSYGNATITCRSAADKQIKAAVKITVSPKDVTGLKAIDVKTTQYTLAWKKSDEANAYFVYRLDSKSGKKVKIAETVKNRLTVKRLKPGTKNTYYVAAVKNDGKKGAVKSGYGKKLIASTKPQSPAKLIVKAISESDVTLKWSKSKGADLYYIYQLDQKSEKYVLIGKTNKNSFKVKKLKKGKAYYYRVRPAVKLAGETVKGSQTKPVKAKTLK